MALDPISQALLDEINHRARTLGPLLLKLGMDEAAEELEKTVTRLTEATQTMSASEALRVAADAVKGLDQLLAKMKERS